MHVISARALTVFFILEFLLVGVLAMIGQIPIWAWFVASAVLLAALLVVDHRVPLWTVVRRLRPDQLSAALLAVAAFFAISGTVLALALMKPSSELKDAKAGAAEQKALAPAQVKSSMEQSLLAIVAVKTEKQHDPLRVSISVVNAGRLPTTKALASIDLKILDVDITDTDIVDAWFADRAAKATPLMREFTLVPGQLIELALWHEAITKELHDQYMASKKFVYVLFAIDYVDRRTEPGKRMIVELAMRPANPRSGVEEPFKNWALVKHRSYVLE